MRAVWWIVPLIAGLAPAWQGPEAQAVRKVVAAFNDVKERPRLLTPDADVAAVTQYGGREVSQVYFEVRAVRFVTADVAFVDARASQYGSTIMKRTMPAYFVLKKVEGAWRVAVMRIGRRPSVIN